MYLSTSETSPMAGDDLEAKRTISRLIEEIGFGPLDAGSLKEGSKFQGAGGIIYGKDITVEEAELLIKSSPTA